MYGDEGEIKLADGIGLSDQQIAGILQIKLSLWKAFKQRMIKTQRIEVSDGNVISVIQWRKYQSEYRRQKNYREKLQTKVTTQSYNQKLQPEVTTRSYNQKLQPEVTNEGYKGKLQGEGDKKEIRRREERENIYQTGMVIPPGLEEEKEKKEKSNKKERKEKELSPPSTPQIVSPQFEVSLSSGTSDILLPENYIPKKKDIDPAKLPQEWHRIYFLVKDNTVIMHPGRFVKMLIEDEKKPKEIENRILQLLQTGRKLDKRTLERALSGPARSDPKVRVVFSFWQKLMNHPRATLDDRRRRHIQWALENYGLEDCLKAIAGNKLSDFHQGRTPENRTVYDQIDLIFRNAEKVETFLSIWRREMEEQKPPKGFESLEKEIREIIHATETD